MIRFGLHLVVFIGPMSLTLAQPNVGEDDDGRRAKQAARGDLLYLKGVQLAQDGSYRDSLILFKKALQLQEEGRGAKHYSVGLSLYRVADAYKSLEEYDKAVPALIESLKILEEARPNEKEAIGITCFHIGDLYASTGDAKNSAIWKRRAADILKTVLKKSDPNLASTMVDAIDACREAKDFEGGESVLAASLQIFRDANEIPTSLSAVLHDFARSCLDHGDYGRAATWLSVSVEILETRLGKKHQHVGDAHYDLGKLFERLLQPEDARDHYSRALEIYKHSNVDKSLLVAVFRKVAEYEAIGGNYETAKGQYKYALDEAKSLELSDEDLVDLQVEYCSFLLNHYEIHEARSIISNLMEVAPEKASFPLITSLLLLNEFEQLIPLLKAETKRLMAPGSNPEELAQAFHLLSFTQRKTGRNADSRESHAKATSILRQHLGDDSWKVLLRDARDAKESGDWRRAESLYLKGIRLGQEERELSAQTAAISIGELASVRVHLGPERFAEAKQNLHEVINLRERIYGPRSIQLAAFLNNAARSLLLMDDQETARVKVLRAVDLASEYTLRVVPYLSLQEQRSLYEGALSGYVASCFREGWSDSTRRRMYTYTLIWKGMLIESLRRRNSFSIGVADPIVRSRLLQLRNVEIQLAEHLRAARDMQIGTWTNEYKDLTAKRENLERVLLKSGTSLPKDAFDVEDPLIILKEALGESDVLIDLFRIRELGEADIYRYEAVIVAGKGPPRFISLGPPEVVDKAVANWRTKTMAWEDATHEWNVLRSLVWSKVEGEITGHTRVCVATDGVLSLVPWHLFPRKEDSIEITLVNSARELVNLRNRASARNGLPEGEQRLYWLRLAQGSSPPDFLKKRFQISEWTVGSQQASDVLEALSESTVGYIGVHGMNIRQLRIGSDRQKHIPGRSQLAQVGILIQGSKEGKNETITALDFLRTQLNTCELLLLAGCDSGRGTAVDAQGVLGVRSSIIGAGAEAAIVSLWKVPREATDKLVREFLVARYEKRFGLATALRTAQAAVRDDTSGRFQAHRHWAGWVVIGGLD